MATMIPSIAVLVVGLVPVVDYNVTAYLLVFFLRPPCRDFGTINARLQPEESPPAALRKVQAHFVPAIDARRG